MVEIYLDGADLKTMGEFEPRVQGFTTNPSLMKKAGISSYKEFAASILLLTKKPVSFEVFADDLEEMDRQAHIISSWGPNVFVKIPVMNSKGESTASLVNKLSYSQIKVNITAIFTLEQIRIMARYLSPHVPAILSIFAGRIMDTGRDAMNLFTEANRVKQDKTKILWASTREVYNLRQAQACNADIITMTADLIKKTDLFDKDLTEYSQETVKMFLDDSKGLWL